jgi:pre-mRNA-processing factor 8
MLDPLEVHLLDFPNIVIRPSELQLPFQAALKVEKLGDLILKATEPQMVLFNLYDDWLKTISSYTAFSRLVLILRALHVNNDRTKMILRPDKSIITEMHSVWPTLTDDQWVKVEVELRDLILADYGKKNGVNVSSLTNSEMRDIILGQEIVAPSQQRQAVAEIEEQQEQQAQATALTVRTTDIHGNEIFTTTQSIYEQEVFASKTEWRTRAIATSNLYVKTKHIFVNTQDIRDDDNITYIMPKNILKRFITIADTRLQIGAYLFGASPPDNAQVKEIRAIVLIPQLGRSNQVRLPNKMPEHEFLLKDLEPLGWIHTEMRPNRDEEFLLSADIITQAHLQTTAPGWGPQSIVMTASFQGGSIQLAAYKLTESGLEWGSTKPYEVEMRDFPGWNAGMAERTQLLLSDRITGFWLVPEDERWNYSFMGPNFKPDIGYAVVPGHPAPFFAPQHRPDHFRTVNPDEGDVGADRDDAFD